MRVPEKFSSFTEAEKWLLAQLELAGKECDVSNHPIKSRIYAYCAVLGVWHIFVFEAIRRGQ